jgi:hypothetical protein
LNLIAGHLTGLQLLDEGRDVDTDATIFTA